MICCPTLLGACIVSRMTTAASTMKTTEINRSRHIAECIDVTVRFDDAEPRPRRYSSTHIWRPGTLTVRWTRSQTDDDDWSDWDSNATVRGHRVKKDGTNGQSFAERLYRPRPGDEFHAEIEATRPR